MRSRLALAYYLDSLTNETTKTNYRIVLEDFLEDIRNISDITSRIILSYKGTLISKAPQTVAARLAAIRSFCDFCWSQGWLSTDPSLPIKNNPVEKYASAKNIEFKDFKKILSKIDLSTLVGLRDYLLLRLIFVYGDPSAILSIPFHQELHKTLQPFKKEYEKKLAEKTNVDSFQFGYLFFNLESCINAKPLSLSSCRKVIAKYTKRAGYPAKFLDFQAMKRLRAKQIYEQTNSVEAVSQFCGHKSLKVTKAFINTLNLQN